MNTTTKKTQRDYAMFDADISGAVLNLHLLTTATVAGSL